MDQSVLDLFSMFVSGLSDEDTEIVFSKLATNLSLDQIEIVQNTLGLEALREHRKGERDARHIKHDENVEQLQEKRIELLRQDILDLLSVETKTRYRVLFNQLFSSGWSDSEVKSELQTLFVEGKIGLDQTGLYYLIK